MAWGAGHPLGTLSRPGPPRPLCPLGLHARGGRRGVPRVLWGGSSGCLCRREPRFPTLGLWSVHGWRLTPCRPPGPRRCLPLSPPQCIGAGAGRRPRWAGRWAGLSGRALEPQPVPRQSRGSQGDSSVGAWTSPRHSQLTEPRSPCPRPRPPPGPSLLLGQWSGPDPAVWLVTRIVTAHKTAQGNFTGSRPGASPPRCRRLFIFCPGSPQPPPRHWHTHTHTHSHTCTHSDTHTHTLTHTCMQSPALTHTHTHTLTHTHTHTHSHTHTHGRTLQKFDFLFPVVHGIPSRVCLSLSGHFRAERGPRGPSVLSTMTEFRHR